MCIKMLLVPHQYRKRGGFPDPVQARIITPGSKYESSEVIILVRLLTFTCVLGYLQDPSLISRQLEAWAL